MKGWWPWGYVPVPAKEYDELVEKAEKLEAVKILVTKWREEIKEHFDTPDERRVAAIAIGLCSNELNDILEGAADENK